MDRSSTSASSRRDEPPQGAETAAAPDGSGHASEGEEATVGGDANDGEADHLADVPDGAGCTEIWDHLSERRSRG